MRQQIAKGIDQIDEAILRLQKWTSSKVMGAFHFNATLLLVSSVGASWGIINGDCTTAIDLKHPLAVMLICFGAFIMFLSFISVPYTIARIGRAIFIMAISFYFASEFLGLYHIRVNGLPTFDVGASMAPCSPPVFIDSIWGVMLNIVAPTIYYLIMFEWKVDR